MGQGERAMVGFVSLQNVGVCTDIRVPNKKWDAETLMFNGRTNEWKQLPKLQLKGCGKQIVMTGTRQRLFVMIVWYGFAISIPLVPASIFTITISAIAIPLQVSFVDVDEIITNCSI